MNFQLDVFQVIDIGAEFKAKQLGELICGAVIAW